MPCLHFTCPLAVTPSLILTPGPTPLAVNPSLILTSGPTPGIFHQTPPPCNTQLHSTIAPLPCPLPPGLQGVGACLLRDIPFNALYFSSYAGFKDLLKPEEGPISPDRLLLAGACACLYPQTGYCWQVRVHACIPRQATAGRYVCMPISTDLLLLAGVCACKWVYGEGGGFLALCSYMCITCT